MRVLAPSWRLFQDLIGWRIARVAGIAVLAVLVLYAVVVFAIDVSVFRGLITDADQRVLTRMASLSGSNLRSPRVFAPQEGPQPIYLWFYGLDGKVATATPQAPDVPDGLRAGSHPTSLDLAGHHFRVSGVQANEYIPAPGGQFTQVPAGWLMAGTSVDDVYSTVLRLALIEAGLALPLGLLVFLGALWIARRSVAPVEEARRRQLAFTADASHELRTPLTVIEAEASLALLQDRDAGSYKQSIERIAGEGARLRRIVEDLLWLARFESEPTRPESGTVDVGAIATEAVARFRTVADQRSIRLTGSVGPLQAPLVAAPPEWIDRLAGVLVDNACRYSSDGGLVDVSVVTAEGRVRLAVDDSGPGIPPAERAQIFDRFHRANNKPGGAGLGLAIGNAIVTATGGRWEVAESLFGGARMAVSWPQVRGGREGEQIVERSAPPSDTAPSGSAAVGGLNAAAASTKPVEDRRQHLG
jgi:signal transduction histidine kinase